MVEVVFMRSIYSKIVHIYNIHSDGDKQAQNVPQILFSLAHLSTSVKLFQEMLNRTSGI